jgi:hypothetical protein
MALVENLFIFFSDTGVEGTLSNGDIIEVLFDKTSDSFSFDTEGRQITALIKTSDAVGISRNDSISIEGNSYTITQILPDQDGKFTNLILSE